MGQICLRARGTPLFKQHGTKPGSSTPGSSTSFINLQMTLGHLWGKMWLQIPEVDIATSNVVRSRIDEHIKQEGSKQEASNVLAGIGLSVSDTILILLSRITADKVLTFEVNR